MDRSIKAAAVLTLAMVASANAQVSTKSAPASKSTSATPGRYVELPIDSVEIEQLRVTTRGTRLPGGFSSRDNCPQTSMHSTDLFNGGTFTLQGGFAQNEIAAVSYTLQASRFPLKITGAEFLIGQQNASVTTTTQWSVLIWDGLPGTGQLVAEFSSDGSILPHVVMAPGTRATNVNVQVDPSDPDQVFVFGTHPSALNTFSVGFRIDRHNNQTQNPCTVAPPATQNAFPATDNSVVGCGTGYGQLQQPAHNWLYGLNCGGLGCPPNGGWARFSSLSPDTVLGGGFCLTGCRPRGDWVIRATWDPVNCPGVPGACCIAATNACLLFDIDTCNAVGGQWMGANTNCADNNGNGRADFCEPPNPCPPCPADFNRSGGTPDDADVAAYFDAWNNGDPCADANLSGGTPDDADVAAFFDLWNAGGC